MVSASKKNPLENAVGAVANRTVKAEKGRPKPSAERVTERRPA
jgi:hypothetical protein